MKTQTFLIYCQCGVGMWRICRDAECYRCSIIDKAEKKQDIPVEKGETVCFLGTTRTEDGNWKDTTPLHNI
eukprot:16451640-Heterocapsa_arctica.AAC.1